MAKLKEAFAGIEQLSLGISMVVAILIGIGLGLLLKNIFDIDWLLWVGVVWGVGGAIMNVYKAYTKLKRELDEDIQDISNNR
jgi:F0F1-type ATP synthase assembly protein I